MIGPIDLDNEWVQISFDGKNWVFLKENHEMILGAKYLRVYEANVIIKTGDIPE